MEFELTPFSKKELAIKVEIISFKERNMPFALLIESNVKEAPNSNNYRFGVINDAGKFWFFNGVATTNDRAKAIEVYNALVDYCAKNKVGTPFAYKEYAKRE